MRRSLIYLLLGFTGVFILLAGVLYATSQPGFCASCHEMKNDYKAWQSSTHANVTCTDCHIGSGAVNFVTHKIYALAEVIAHFRGSHKTPINNKSELSKELPSKNCLPCHATLKKESNNKVQFKHKVHKKYNFTCAYCHNRVAHPGLKGFERRMTMQFCTDCHTQKKASTDCRTCHPASFDIAPASHKSGDWISVHGKSVSQECFSCHTDRQGFCDSCHKKNSHPGSWVSIHPQSANPNCTILCHSGSFCDNCHKTQNPHPANWLSAHPQSATSNCTALCHAQSFCDTCHKTRNPHQANWVSIHPRSANSRCTTLCHGQSFCTKCHRSRNPHPANWISVHPQSANSGCTTTCHTQSFCNNCHRTRNPHPSGWISIHEGRANQTCYTCHSSSFCSNCHAKNGD